MTDREYHRAFTCPFCGKAPEEPHTIKMRFGETMGGRCSCGAVYVYDETGRMLGEAFTDALALLYGEDYDAAFGAPEEAYEEETVSYNARLRRYVRGAGVLDRSAKFLFLRKKNSRQT